MKILTVVLVLVVLLGGGYMAFQGFSSHFTASQKPLIIEPEGFHPIERDPFAATSTNDADLQGKGVETVVPYEVIGQSVESRPIEAYHFGTGEKKLVFVGALHGGYSWNTALLAYELIDYLTGDTAAVPTDLQVIVIPVANPDGLAKIVGTSTRFDPALAPHFDYASEISPTGPEAAGRSKAHGIDLNRNFECPWVRKGVWRDQEVDAGAAAFSEPESQVLRDFFLRELPVAVVFFDSAGDGVFASSCNGDPLPGTFALLSAYGDASGYPQHNEFAYYKITGDAADWLATQNIPAITVELSTHTVIEWERNLPAIERLLAMYTTLK
jgi:hypothetical protein